MIAKLRRRHRRTWLVLAIVIPAIIVAAWQARRPAPVMDHLPAALREGAKP